MQTAERLVTRSAATITLVCCAMAHAGVPGDHALVKTEISVSRNVLRPGERGDIVLHLDPSDGIHVNARPPVTFAVAPGGIVILDSLAEQPIDVRHGYLATSHPVRQPFHVLPDTRPGEYTLRGTCTYFYCSDNEGWCRKASLPIELTFTIMK